MKTYYDENRVVMRTDRRFHAADVELAGGYLQIVPAVAENLVPGIQVSALGWTEGQLIGAEAIQAQDGDLEAATQLRVQRWWTRQWRKPNGVYRLRVLTSDERALARSLLGRDGIPKEAFPRADGPLDRDNDANIVAQVIAVGGTLVLTSNMVMIHDELLQGWFDRKHNEWPNVQAGQLIARVDKLYCKWWKHEAGPRVLTRSALGAFWPEVRHATADEVIEETVRGLEAMARGHFEEFAPKVLNRLRTTARIESEVEEVRRRLPERMREAERERQTLVQGGAEEPESRSTGNRRQDQLGRFHW